MDMIPLIRAAAAADIAAMQQVAEATELFPGDMLPDMIAPALAGEDPAIWLVAVAGDAVVGFAQVARIADYWAEGDDKITYCARVS